MHIYNDDIRREAKAIDAEHDREMRSTTELLDRLFDDEGRVSRRTKADVILGGFDRRRFLRIGGLSILTASVLAACGSDEDATEPDETTTTTEGAAGDVTILRTASSIELLAVDVYDQAIKAEVVKTKAVADAAKLFQGHHRQHADALIAKTKELGGEPFDKPNQAVLAAFQPKLAAALGSEAGVLALALELERTAAATYQSSVSQFGDVKLAQVAMSIGGIEARHAALLAVVQNQPGAPDVFHKTTGAVAAGTGV